MSTEDISSLFEVALRHAIDYREGLANRPQSPRAGYHEMRAAFDVSTPESGSAGRDVIEQLAVTAEPGLHAMAGPRFFGWVIGASHPVGVAADWLTSAWAQNCGNHEAAPAAAAAEEVAAKWLLDILDLPRRSSVGFVTGATMANFVCLAAARSEVLRRVGWDVDTRGLFGAPAIEILIGDDAHTTVFGALQWLGLGRERVARIATDAQGRMRLDHFASVIGNLAGPIIVVAQAGQINTGAFDRFSEFITLAHERGAWVHVDGAFGLWARACPESRSQTEGMESADSWATDGHKWLQTPYDCGYAIVRDVAAHRRSMTVAASYLPAGQESDRDPSHYVPELSRRARGFATWAMIRYLGRDGIARMVARHCALARQLAQRLAAESGIVVLNDVVLNQVVARCCRGDSPQIDDALTQRVIEHVQAEAVCFVGGTLWKGRRAIRFSVISWPTSQDDVERSAQAVIDAWRACRDLPLA